MAVVKLLNPLDGNDEFLLSTYKSPEVISIPTIKEELNVNIPFGRLFSGDKVPTITSTIQIDETAGSEMVGDVDVIVDIRHSWVGDLKLELEHNEKRILLVLGPGGQTCSRDNLFTTTFDTGSSSNVTLTKTMSSPGLCRFQTQGLFSSEESLADFNGYPIDGNWTLRVTDVLTEKDNGRLVSWGLVIRPLEDHLIAYDPPVVPLLTASGLHEERHHRDVVADGRIAGLTVSVHLAIPFVATRAYLPTLKLMHPDGTMVVLSDDSYPLCAYGNFSYVIFDDRAASIANYTDYSCSTLYSNTTVTNDTSGGNVSRSDMALGSGLLSSGSGSGSNSGSGSGIDSNSGSGSGADSGSAFGSGMSPQRYLPTIHDLIKLNITIPIKDNLIDMLAPQSNLSLLYGKTPNGRWTLLMSSQYNWESTLVGWSLMIAREPNINHHYDPTTSTLTFTGIDSTHNYQSILRGIMYNNTKNWPNFSETRHIKTMIYDEDGAGSNSTQFGSQSYIVVHHVEIDLDPLDLTEAQAPNFAATFREHSHPIPIVDPANAILTDDGFQYGIYSLTITLRNYSNYDQEGSDS